MEKGLDIAVVGGGVIGLACARALQRDGHRVVVHDPAPAADTAAAWGSAGVFAVDSVSPFATPETLRALPTMLLHRDSGLSLRWGYMPRLLPWLFRFLWNARPAASERGAAVLAALCAEGLAGWGALLGERAAARLVRPGGWVTAFETEAGLRAARADVERRLRHGVVAEWLDGPDLRRRVPQLGEHVVGGVYYEQSRFCPDPAALLATLVADIEAAGGGFRRAPVSALAPAAATVDVLA
ncbi:MAG: FAD-dependent oxidoreductase, partial [Halofilum sp. (in: g-proteobacteria)]|nr:FAD-dependent oxidoreductase [Halofilum sp. (in: g-proteobacteria)]